MASNALTRNRADGLLGGVCAGLAVHLGVPTSWVRVAMVAFALLGGAGVLLYLWLWVLAPDGEQGDVAPMRRALVTPAQPAVSPPEQQARTPASESERLLERARRMPIAELLLGACLLVAGIGLVLVQFGVQLRLEIMLPALAVLAGVGLTWWQIADLKRPERNALPRVLGALALVAVGVLMFFVTAGQPNTMTIVGAALAVLAGVALALAPWALRVNRELIAERAARAREAERAEIAAHLHDSVLQSLAAIQQRSAPGSEVARIARLQERELREWLFRSADGEAHIGQDSVEAELRTHAVALEAVHEVRFEVVTVGGDRPGSRASCSMPSARGSARPRQPTTSSTASAPASKR